MNTLTTLDKLDLQPGDVVRNENSRNPYDVVLIDDDTDHPFARLHDKGELVALERGGVGHQDVAGSFRKNWWVESRAVRNETAEADRPLEPQTEGTHIHAALLAQDDALPELEIVPAKRKLPGAVSIIRECLTNKEWGSGLVESDLPPEFKSERLNAEEMEELRVLGQRTGGLIEVIPGKRKPMDSAGDLIRNYPDLATDLAADDEFTAAFLNALAARIKATEPLA